MPTRRRRKWRIVLENDALLIGVYYSRRIADNRIDELSTVHNHAVDDQLRPLFMKSWLTQYLVTCMRSIQLPADRLRNEIDAGTLPKTTMDSDRHARNTNGWSCRTTIVPLPSTRPPRIPQIRHSGERSPPRTSPRRPSIGEIDSPDSVGANLDSDGASHSGKGNRLLGCMSPIFCCSCRRLHRHSPQ